MKEPLVSIIVPVYHVAAYLEQCIASIQSQSYAQFECLLVDDGSTDGSGLLCDRAAQADSRFTVIHQPNSGVSAARNRAMDQAQGKYLQFVDGDDWLTQDATETLVHAAEATGCDLVISHFYRVAGQRKICRGHIRTAGVMTRQEFAEQMVKAPANYYYGVLWNKLYRRSTVEAHRLRCDSQVDWCEDFLFNLEYFQYARLITSVPRPLYYYRKREDSLVSTQTSLRRVIATKKETFAAYKELYQKLDLYEEQKGRIYGYFLSAATDGAVPHLAGARRPGRRAAPHFLPRGDA